MIGKTRKITALFISAVLFVAPVFMITGCSDDTFKNNKSAEQNSNNGAAPGDTAYDTAESGDAIGIISVDPNAALTDGIEYSFTVNTEYILVSVDNAELNIGFNTENAFSYSLISGAAAAVSKGSGEHTFTVSATAKAWGAAGDFKVYVNLSESPDSGPPRILVDAVMVIGVE